MLVASIPSHPEIIPEYKDSAAIASPARVCIFRIRRIECQPDHADEIDGSDTRSDRAVHGRVCRGWGISLSSSICQD